MILFRFDDNEYYIAKPISNVVVGEHVYVSGYNTFGEITGYANTTHNLIKIKGKSTYFSVSQHKLYEIIGSTKVGFRYSLNRKDLDFQFGAYTPKEIIQYFLNYCGKNVNTTIEDFSNLFFDKNKTIFDIEEINLDSPFELCFGDIKQILILF